MTPWQSVCSRCRSKINLKSNPIWHQHKVQVPDVGWDVGVKGDPMQHERKVLVPGFVPNSISSQDLIWHQHKVQVPSFGETFNVQSRPNATPAQSVGSSFWSKSRHQIKTQCDTSTKCRFQVCGWGLDLGGPVSKFRGFIKYRTLRRSEQVFCAEPPPDAPECAFWTIFLPKIIF